MVKISRDKESAVTPELLRLIFTYDDELGVLRRKSNGSVVGCLSSDPNKYSYVKIRVEGSDYQIYLHRAVWAHQKGAWPVGLLDHEDNDKSNCRIGNLRPADFSQNGANRKIVGNSVSRYKGVRKNQKDNGFVAMLQTGGKSVYLGYYPSDYLAAKAYDKEARSVFGEFAKTNFSDNSDII